jgi:hypothetical protein
LTVESTQFALRLHRDLLGFEVRDTWQASSAELALNGLDRGRLEQTRTIIPGTAIAVVFADYDLAGTRVTAEPFRWRIEDVGSPQFSSRCAPVRKDPLDELRLLDARDHSQTPAAARALRPGWLSGARCR